MAGIKIHQYPLERTSIGDEDYYDIDYWTGSSYQSAKIKGSTLKNVLGANYIDITAFISGYELTDKDAGKLITNSNSNVRTLVIPSGLALPNNMVSVKGRIAIQPETGVNITLPDGSTITDPSQFTCVADEVYILHKSAFTGDNYILVSLKKSENIGTNDLIITDTIRELQVAIDGTFQIVTNDANNSAIFRVGENSNERFSEIELNSITYDVTTAEPNPTNNGAGIITRINPNEYEIESRSDIGNAGTKRSRIYTSPNEVVLEKSSAGKLTLNSLGASNTFEDLRATKKGLEYSADYSANFSVRSLVDKGYVDSGLSLKLNIADAYGGKRYTLIKPNGTKEFYDTLVQVTSNWADGDTLHQFANETLAITNATTISGYICWRELPAINWNGNGHSILFNVTGTSAFAVNANKNINFFDLRLTYNCADNSTSNGLIKSPTTSFLNGNGSTTLAQNVNVSNANHLTAFGLIGNFDNFNITSLHDKTWQVPGFCNGTFTNCNIRNVYTNRAATFIGCNFNEFVANLFSATTIIFDNCTLVNSIDALLTSNQGTVTITNCNMRFNVNSGIIMNATVVMNNSTINNVGNGLMFAAYSGSNNIVRTTGSGGFANTASVVVDYGSIFESTGGWNFRFTGSGSFFERTKFINNGTGGSLNTDVSGTGLKASFVDCIFFCAGTNNVGAVSDTYSFVGCTFNRTNFAFMYAGTQQQLLDNDPKRLTNVIDSRGNKGHGCRSPYPPMTTTERNLLTGVSKGFTIENTTTNFLQVYNGSTWKDLLDLT